MSLTDRLILAQRQRETGTHQTLQQDSTWERKQTSPFTRSTGSLAIAGESELETLSRELGLTRMDLTSIVGMSELMIQRWERGLLQLSGQSSDRIAAIRDIHARLYTMFLPYQALDWMRTANAELGFQTPGDALVAGRLPRVNIALDVLDGSANI